MAPTSSSSGSGRVRGASGGRPWARRSGRPRRQREPPLHGGLHDRLLPRRPGRGAGDAGQDHRPGHGHRDDRGGLHRGGDRRPGLLLGHLPGRPGLRAGALLRHPLHPALFHLLGLRPDGGGADHPAVGPPRATPAMTRRIPWGFLVLLAMFSVPAVGSRFYTFLANDIAIWALFATSLNLLVGVTGLVSFGHAAYFGIGAYTTGLLMKQLSVPFLLAFPAAGVLAGALALVFGFFCVRLTRIYFAMLTLAFAQIVWAICFKWNEVTGGEQGMPDIPYPGFGWIAGLPLIGG